MESNYVQAETAIDEFRVVSESLTALSELTVTDESCNIELSEVARDGLADILAMLADKLNEGIEKLAQQKRKSGNE